MTIIEKLEYDFYCKFLFKDTKECIPIIKTNNAGNRVKEFDPISVGGRSYTLLDAFQKTKLKEFVPITKRKSESCYVAAYLDFYDSPVIVLCKEIPCFGIEDREWDSTHNLFIFHNGKSIYALYCTRGYKICQLILCNKMLAVDNKIKPILKELDFPVSDVEGL